MRITADELERSVLAARSKNYDLIFADVEWQFRFPEWFLMAIGSRETNLRHVNGDGGHGRSIMQIDDRYHQGFLQRHNAVAPEFVPDLYCSIHYAGRLLHSHRGRAQLQGVTPAQMIRFISAAYNAGFGGATDGWKQGDIDKFTAHGDYGRDVVSRRKWIAKHAERLGLRRD